MCSHVCSVWRGKGQVRALQALVTSWISYLLVLAGGEDGMVRVFDLRDGAEVAQLAAADDTGARA